MSSSVILRRLIADHNARSEAISRLIEDRRGVTAIEYGLIAALAAQAGQVVGHRTLLRTVWGPGYGDERHYLRTFVHRLRAKLEADPKHPEVIVTIGERGYRFGLPAAMFYSDPYLDGRWPGTPAA